jgi:hypothetical protein
MQWITVMSTPIHIYVFSHCVYYMLAILRNKRYFAHYIHTQITRIYLASSHTETKQRNKTTETNQQQQKTS